MCFYSLGNSPNPYTTPLDAAVVQSWVAGGNYGLRMVAGVDNVHMSYVPTQREESSSRPLSMRPLLTINYRE